MIKKYAYEEIEQAVRDYQNGVEGASQKIVDAFTLFLNKYMYLLKGGGPVSLGDPSIRRFISLYIKDPRSRRAIESVMFRSKVRSEAYKTMNFLRQLFEPYDAEDLWNDLVVTLLTLASRYKSPDNQPRFHMYVEKTFHYAAYRALTQWTKDVIWWGWDDIGTIRADEEPSFEPPPPPDRNLIFRSDEDDPKIDNNWVLGLTASDEFQELTALERRILKLYYVDGYSDQQIGEFLGVGRSTVNRKRREIKEKIKHKLNRQRSV